MKLDRITIVGVGLIGGSIGLAVKKRGLARRVRGVGRRQQSLDRAVQVGAVDETSLDFAEAASDSNLIILCTPVDRIGQQVLQMAPHCQPGTIITDAGSTKGNIVAAVDGRMPDGVTFIGSHPLAGSEKRGPEHGDADLFEGRWTVVTPSNGVSQEVLRQVTAFWQGLGSRVKVLTPAEHDRMLALSSHLPHLVASALAGILPDDCHDVTATGFRDTTRIAAGDAELWTAIFAHNRQALLDSLTLFEKRLQEFRAALQQRDDARITELLTQAKMVRDALGN